MARVTGTVKMFIDQMRRQDGADGGGYGFIVGDQNGDEMFVHRSDLGASCLQESDGRKFYVVLPGQRVSFETADGREGRGKKAVKVELI